MIEAKHMRRVQVWQEGFWVEADMGAIEEGDVFRLIEPDGTTDGREFVAAGLPHIAVKGIEVQRVATAVQPPTVDPTAPRVRWQFPPMSRELTMILAALTGCEPENVSGVIAYGYGEIEVFTEHDDGRRLVTKCVACAPEDDKS